MDDRIRVKLDQPFGKDNLSQCFRSEACLRHLLLLLWKSGFLLGDGWSALCVASQPAATISRLLRRYGDTDFNPLRGFPTAWADETSVNEQRVHMTSAALLHFNGSAADVVRWVGGPHVAAHRDHATILQRLALTNADSSVLSELQRIFTCGIPKWWNVASTEDNFQAFYNYGNHATVIEEPEKTYQALVKDNKKGYTLLFDEALVPFVLNGHVTPQGVVDLNTPYKNPRPIFDSSFRPLPWCYAINDWTDKSYEPPLTFAHAEMGFMIELYNIRLSYPYEDIYLADDDISGAFRQIKYHPNLAGTHTSVQCGFGVLNTGATFGDNTSPSNFDPIARARRFMSHYLWTSSPDVVERVLPFLPPITTAPLPTPAEAALFAQSDRDNINTGVIDGNGNRIPPAYHMHVDDNLYADVLRFLVLTVCASAAGLFEILGWPDDPRSHHQ